MKQYWKMADVFNACDVVETDVKVLYAVTEEYDDGVTPHEYAHHAIQYHDELVQMNKELLALLMEAMGEMPQSQSFPSRCDRVIAKARGERRAQPDALRDGVYVAGGKS
jgi:MoxR-like ATPase